MQWLSMEEQVGYNSRSAQRSKEQHQLNTLHLQTGAAGEWCCWVAARGKVNALFRRDGALQQI